MGHREITELLLAHGADIDHADADGRTALSLAALCVPASRGHADVVSLLLERGAHAGHHDRHGMTPLLVAACEGHAEVAELLLEGGADVEQADAAGRTPLLVAAAMGHGAVVQTLLLWGAAAGAKDAKGRTALSLAAAQGSKHVVRTLLERGADPNLGPGVLLADRARLAPGAGGPGLLQGRHRPLLAPACSPQPLTAPRPPGCLCRWSRPRRTAPWGKRLGLVDLPWLLAGTSCQGRGGYAPGLGRPRPSCCGE
uniref:Uncharacterized protein n=1 Tax=Terrapene triunguis TaxID=2587831 RepID=A0A674J0A0_9SAUR